MANATSELTYFSFPIVKFEKNDDGDLIVMGKATDGSVDSDDQIVDTAWSAKALQEWHDSGGNLRVQHQAMRDPAGKSMTVEIDRDGDGGHWVKSLVIEPVAKRLVEKGVLTAYSVGIARPVIKRDPSGKARGGVVCGGSLAELSLVDRPANKACGLVLAKSADGPKGEMELVGEVFGDEDYLSKVAGDPDFLGKADDDSDGGDSGQPGGNQPPAKPGAKPAPPASSGPGASDGSGYDGDDGDGGDDAQDEDDTDGGEDAISKADDGTKIAYRRSRREWLTREPNVKSAVGGTEFLQRRADWMRWNAEGEAEGLNGTRGGAMVWLAKRGVDPDMVKRDFSQAERDSAADSGSAMSDGSFPIKNGGDLSNAIHLAGHAKDPAAARAHIKRRASALGMSDQIPDSWKTEVAAATTGTLADTLVKAGISEPLARVMLGDAFKAAAGPAAVKGSKNCAGCGKNYDADTSISTCENCGKKLPAADAGKADSGSSCSTCNGSGKIMEGKRDCPDCDAASGADTSDDKATEVPEIEKAGGTCKKCGAAFHSDHSGSFCSNCGKKLPGMGKRAKAADPALLELAATVAKSVEIGLITQEAGDEIIATAAEKRGKRPPPGSTSPAKPHREPDGSSTVEQLEPDAGMPTDPDKTPDKVPSSVRGVGEGLTGQKPPSATGPTRKGEAPYSVLRMHDAFCAAWSGDDALEEYPSLKSVTASLSESWWAGCVTEAAEAGKAKKAAQAAQMLATVQDLKAMDAEVVADGRAELHKAFSDMYPTEKIKPSMGIRPGSYQRPYLSAGHAAENASRNGGANVPPSAKVPEPEQFHRPLMTDGHQSDSPANKAGDIRNDAPVRTGASRTYYSNAQREAARVAMQSIHDHISSNFPDMCPMAASKSVLPPDMGARNVPSAASPSSAGGVASVKVDIGADGRALQRSIQDAVLRHARRTATLTDEALEKAAAARGLTLVKAANPGCGCCPDCKDMSAKAEGAVERSDLAAPVAGLTAEQVKTLLTETFNPHADRLAELQKQLDDVAARPDPAMAPVRGALAKASTDTAAPVERRSLVDEAAGSAAAARKQAADDEQASYREYITTLTKSPDPSVRERALTVLNKLNGAL